MIKSNKFYERLGEENCNNQGCQMKIVEYNNSTDIIVEFQDEYKATVHTSYQAFRNGYVKNPYYQNAYGVGIVGIKYPISINQTNIKEYRTWRDMLRRCFDTEYKNKHITYKDATCCKEWLLYENFYEWLHEQKKFRKMVKWRTMVD